MGLGLLDPNPDTLVRGTDPYPDHGQATLLSRGFGERVPVLRLVSLSAQKLRYKIDTWI